DVRNVAYSGQCIVEAGLQHEIVVSVMEMPPGCHGPDTPDFYLGVVNKILEQEVPFHSLCFKDASGTLTPSKVFETARLARKRLPGGTRLVWHTHDTAGLGISQYLAALEGGADQIDLSLSPVSHGTCQPDVITMWHALRGSDFVLDVDPDRMFNVEKVLKECLGGYFVPPESRRVEPIIPFSPMPGGALTANTQMMRDYKIFDRYPDVIRGMGEVVRRGGGGISVTPVSQFYFQQAFNNVMFGPFKKIAPGYGKMVLGYFGRTPVPPDEKIVKLASEQLGLPHTDEDPMAIDDRDPGKGEKNARELLNKASLPVSPENLFIAAICKQKGITFLKGEAEIAIRKTDNTAQEENSSRDAAKGPV
ncbi:MAG: biotin attachment protein, partial [Deltaproteobacteria bacterium]|nr:biotin attachment protein [Deltaproteobacteria bacterium]